MTCNCKNLDGTLSNTCRGTCFSCLEQTVKIFGEFSKSAEEVSETLQHSGYCIRCFNYVTDCKCMWDSIRKLETKIKELDISSVNVQLLYSTRQSIETWQKGCESFISELRCRIKELEDRINNLEMDDSDERLHDIENIEAEKRLIELERFQEITHAQYQKVIKEKKPHTCPNCGGLGLYYNAPTNSMYEQLVDTKDEQGRIVKNCYACEGKGIIWG
ncbi:MAG: hypothetical protein Q8936_14095 [Bacillota bacterium]|nr:hypothetical protein [Bacillota bacterium]